jgi:hypothetical protein
MSGVAERMRYDVACGALLMRRRLTESLARAPRALPYAAQSEELITAAHLCRRGRGLAERL